ncbi:VTT domain-containing protein [Candidatus Woesearchaeota archaeon]|nr:VTT domain-containing protein [Candidatus Woesearchaeota archaeon]
MNLDLFLLYLANYSYLSIAVLMLLSSIGFPFPDDLIMISVGYLSYLKLINPYIAGFEIIFLGLLLDNIYFFLGRYKGKSILDRLSNRSEFIKKIAQQNESYVLRPRKVFIARFVPVLRSVVPFAAGTSEIKWKIFFMYNLFALLIMTPIIIILSFHFSRYLVVFFNLNEKAVGIVLLLLVFLGLIITIIKILIRLFKKSNISQKN